MRALEGTPERPREDRPLAGRSVLVTRPPRQAGELSDRLRALGAEVVELPTIRIRDAPDPAPLRQAAASLRSYDWLILTSVNGVRKLHEALEAAGSTAAEAPGLRTAAIGPATAERVRAAGFAAPVVPGRYRAEALLAAVLAEAGGSLAGRRVLLPRAEGGRDILPKGLRAAGAEVHEVTAYVTVAAEERAPELRRRLEEGVDWITFTASSTVRSFLALAGSELGTARVAAIGPITAATAQELGVAVHVVAAVHTIPGLVRALAEAEAARGVGREGT